MTGKQKKLIIELLKKFSNRYSTDTLITKISETTGLLDACRALQQSVASGDQLIQDWLERECITHNIEPHKLLQELSTVLGLFDPDSGGEDHFAVLGLVQNASNDDIKRAYRRLSLKYHPDTLSQDQEENSAEKFIQINKAYHALTGSGQDKNISVGAPHKPQWQQKRKRSVTPKQRKIVMVVGSSLVAILLVFSMFSAIGYRKRAMLVGLQESRGAFVPPAGKAVTKTKVIEGEDVTSNLSDKIEIKESGKYSEPIKDGFHDHEVLHDSNNINRQEEKGNTDEEPVQIILPVREVITPINTDEIKPALITDTELVEKYPETLKQATTQVTSENKIKPVVDTKSKESVDTGTSIETVAQKKQTLSNQFNTPHTAKSENTRGVNPPTKSSNLDQAVGKLPERNISIEQKDQSGPDTLAVKKEIRNKASENQDISNLGTEASRAFAKGEEKNKLLTAGIDGSPIVEKDKTADMQKRIEQFIRNYESAYKKRNIILFSRFFQPDAIENDKPFIEMLPVYTDLFASTSDVSLRLTILSWKSDGDEIDIEGRFHVILEYQDCHQVAGKGTISFQLQEKPDQLFIKRLTYTFDA